MEALNLDMQTDRSSLWDHPTGNVRESKAGRQMVDIDGNMRLVCSRPTADPGHPRMAWYPWMV